ncbi:hypothetical protein LJ737_10710 [Hymenobacter sp. 15J16-1T3B]|uniref:hypothetical protein n=1 Tax=Hymenobacter sp. 15J16-1T3B TaxID=2886941 RepID=UPI001D1127FD|nr:hypothetical protein [Hymenobacter sp. 15J16-1T3B]MCC3157713.1 hypothetical protein [Hymenobacter sp. 15J16-1T3B]
MEQHARKYRTWLAASLWGAMLLAPQVAKPAEAPSQVQVARRFLLAVLAGHLGAAYRLLAPEAKVQWSTKQFAAAAQPLYAEGQRRGPTIDLYKFGFRIGDVDTQPFCAFMFRSDSTAAKPQVQLDVTFGSQQARLVQGFSLIRLAADSAR